MASINFQTWNGAKCNSKRFPVELDWASSPSSHKAERVVTIKLNWNTPWHVGFCPDHVPSRRHVIRWLPTKRHPAMHWKFTLVPASTFELSITPWSGAVIEGQRITKTKHWYMLIFVNITQTTPFYLESIYWLIEAQWRIYGLIEAQWRIYASVN